MISTPHRQTAIALINEAVSAGARRAKACFELQVSERSRPRVSNDNPFSESLFRTCKYRPDWPTKGFATKADVQAWVKSFTSWYNDEHLHSAIRFVTPNERQAGHDRGTLVSRAILYANVRARNPERWSGKVRNWKPAGPIWLNPETDNSAPEIRDAA